MPKKYDPKKKEKKEKKMDTSMSMKKKKEKKKISIYPCPHDIQIKERDRFIKGVFHSTIHHPPSTYVHDLDQLV